MHLETGLKSRQKHTQPRYQFVHREGSIGYLLIRSFFPTLVRAHLLPRKQGGGTALPGWEASEARLGLARQGFRQACRWKGVLADSVPGGGLPGSRVLVPGMVTYLPNPFCTCGCMWGPHGCWHEDAGVRYSVGMRTRVFVTLLTHIWLPEAHQGLADGMGGRARKLGWETGAMECSSATREVRATPRADG